MKVQKAGCVLINLQNKKIGLVFRKQKEDYTFPKGHLEKGETLQQCAIRETIEETGRSCHLISDKELIILEYLTPSGEDVENYIYLAVDDGVYNGKIAKEDKEMLVWKSIEEVEDILSYENLKEMWRKIRPQIYSFINMIQIKEYEEVHVEDISKIIIDNLIKINSKDYEKQQIEEMIEQFGAEKLKEAFRKRKKVFVAMHQGEVIGTAGVDISKYNDNEYCILTVFVKIENHGQGIGRMLINKIEEYTKENKINKLIVPASITACEFYQKLGYKYKDDKKELNEENMYIMEKELN